jgi:predicted phage-related endonuclease
MANLAVRDEAEWLSVRSDYVGGSEVASLFYRYLLADGSEVVRHAYEAVPEGSTPLGCLSSWRSGFALFNEKAGIVMPADFSSERVDAGRFMEPALAEWSKHKWGWPMRKVRRYSTHDGVKGWGASLDYELHGEGQTGVPVEFKNVDRGVFATQWTVDGDEIIAPPLYYLLQVQHQMGAVGADHAWIVACVGGNELKRGRIARHEPTQQRIADAVEAFWAGVAVGEPPLRVADFDAVSKAFAFGDKGRHVDLTGEPEFETLVNTYLADKDRLDKLDTLVDGHKAKIALQLGDATKATAGGFRLSWPVIVREEKIIPARKQEAKTYRGALTISGGK